MLFSFTVRSLDPQLGATPINHADEVTLSRKGAKNQTHSRSLGTKRRHQAFMAKLDDASATRSLPLTTIA
jgi:hypothetical protein